MKPQTMIVVSDVEASSRWYQRLLACRSGHGGREYEQLIGADGTLLLQLHSWDAHEHPHMGDPGGRPYGNGVLLWFETEAFDAAVERAHAMSATIVDGPLVNPNARHREV